MATFDFRILLETVQGRQSSYISQSFVDTSVDLVLSASQVYHRITGISGSSESWELNSGYNFSSSVGMVSCSFQNSSIFTGEIQPSSASNIKFADNIVLSASLTGSANTGSLTFDSVINDYDRLYRYKFYGEKVCNVLGLPENQWIYTEQFALNTDDENNYFEGNVNATNIFLADTLTFAGNANINSDIPIYIDTGSDRYIKFIDVSGTPDAALLVGYDKNSDTYEISASANKTFNIGGVDELTVGRLNVNTLNTTTTTEETVTMTVEGSITASQNISASGYVSASEVITRDGAFFGDSVNVDGNVTADSFTTTMIDADFSDGSTIFGDTLDDTHLFTGSLTVTSSQLSITNDTLSIKNISGSHYGTGSFGALRIPDNGRLRIGDGEDLHIFHNGSHSNILDKGAGNLILGGSVVQLKDESGSELFLQATKNAGVDLYYDNSKKFETETGGVNVTGQITASGDVKFDSGIELGHISDTTLTRASAGDVNIEGNIIYRAGGTDVPVSDGGTGVSTLTDGGVLLGSGTGGITAMSVLSDGEMIVGDGTGDPVAESGATLRTSIGVGTGDNVQFTNITATGNTTLGNASTDTHTITGNITSNGTITTNNAISTSKWIRITKPEDTLANSALLLQPNIITLDTGSDHLKLYQSVSGNLTKHYIQWGDDNGDQLILRFGHHSDDNIDLITLLAPPSGENRGKVGINVADNTGNILDDSHFTASLTVFGTISASEAITASAFKGDGAGLTNVTSNWDGTHNGDGQITGSLVVTGDITGSNITATGKLSGSTLELDGGNVSTVGDDGLRIYQTDDHLNSGSFTIYSSNWRGSGAERTRMIIGVTSASAASSGRGSFINTTYNTGGTFALRFLQGGTEKMRIAHLTGNVGIGTTSPDNKLEVHGDTYITGSISGSSTTTASFGAGYFDTSVGIGTTTPTAKLTVDGDVAISASGDIDIANEKRIRFATSNGNYSDDGSLRRASGEAIRFRYNNNSFIFDATENDHWEIRNSGDSPVFRVNTNNGTSIFSGSAGTFVALNHSNGRVGIGTTSPSDLFHVSGANGTEAVIETVSAGEAKVLAVRNNLANDTTDDSVSIQFSPDNRQDNAARIIVGKDGDFSTGANIDTNMQFVTVLNNSSNEVMRLTSDGNVGIGTDSPSEELEVIGNISASGHLYLQNSKKIFLDANEAATGSVRFLSGDSEALLSSFNSSTEAKSRQFVLKHNFWNTEFINTRSNGQLTLSSSAGIGINTSSYNTKLPSDLVVGGDLRVETHITASGNISSSVTSTGSLGRLELVGTAQVDGRVGIGTDTPLDALHVEQGDIRIDSATDETLALRWSEASDTRTSLRYHTVNNVFQILTDNAAGTSTERINILGEQNQTQVDITGNLFANYLTSSGDLTVVGSGSFGGINANSSSAALTIEGDISTSGDFHSNSRIHFNQPLSITGSITASGDISASGTIMADKFQSVGNDDTISFEDNLYISGSISGSTTTTASLGMVGIGVNNPQQKLHVSGNIYLGSDGAIETPHFIHANNRFALSSDSDILIVADSNITNKSTSNKITFGFGSAVNTNTNEDFTFNDAYASGTGSNEVMVIKGDTLNVGIGNNSPSERLDVEGNIMARDKIVSEGFESGFGGSGWRIETGSGGSAFTVDDLTVRGTMNVFELLIHQIRATNGSLFVSNTGKITSASLSSVDNHYSMSFDTGSGYGHSFIIGDLVRAQRFVPSTNGSGSQVFRSDLHIVNVNGTGSAIAVLSASSDEQHPLSQSAPQVGYEYVRIGHSNSESSSRQGSIYLTADDDNAPFIDVVDTITSHSHFNTSGRVKTRLGKLDGITTANSAFGDSGTLNGFGLYASGSVFLEGGINATSGSIGGWNIHNDKIEKNSVSIESAGIIRLGSATDIDSNVGVYLSGSNNGAFRVGDPSGEFMKWDGTDLSIKSSNLNITASNIDMTTNQFELDSNTGDLQLSSTQRSMSLGDGKIILSGSTVPRIWITGGEITASKFKVSSEGEVSASAGTIGGFTIDDHSLTSDGVEINNATVQGLFISSSNFKVDHDGNITGSNIQLTGSVKATSGEVGGFSIGTNLISSSVGELILSASGQITASAVSMSGTITATSGLIGGFVIDGSEISASDGGLVLSASGQITGSNVLFDGGKIANWTIEDKRIINPFDDQAGTQGSLIMSTTSSVAGNVFDQATTFMKGFSVRTRASSNTWAFQLGEMFLDSDGTQFSSKTNWTKDKWFGFQAVELGGDGVDSDLFTIAADTTNDAQNNYQARIAGWNFDTTAFYNSNVTMSNADGGFININSSSILLSGSGEGQLANGGIIFDKEGNLTVSGSLISSDGTIGGFTIDDNKISSTNLVISSSTGTDFVISASGFNIKADGKVTASAVSMSGTIIANDGLIGGFQVGSALISSSNGALILKDNGQITGSAISMSGTVVTDTLDATGGTIGGFQISTTQINDTGNNLILKDSGQITGSEVSMSGTIITDDIKAIGGTIGGFQIGETIISASSGVLKLTSDGQITASAVSMSGTIVADSGEIGGFEITNSHISSSGLVLKSSGQITSSNVLLTGGTIQGDITMSNDVRIEGGIQIGGLPIIPSDEHLKGHWIFDSINYSSSFGEGVGSIIDVSGNANHAMHLGERWVTSSNDIGAVVGNSLQTYDSANNTDGDDSDGDGGGVMILDHDTISGHDNQSYTFWFNPAGGYADVGGDNTAKPRILSRDRSEFFSICEVKSDWSSQTGSIEIAHGESIARELDNVIFKNQWHFAALTMDYIGRKQKFYLYQPDGNLITSEKDLGIYESPSGSNPSVEVSSVTLGCNSDSSTFSLTNAQSDNWSGSFDEVRYYDKILTPSEVDALFINPAGIESTIINGDQITTGQIKSETWNHVDEGSMIDLENGQIHFGGSGSNADLHFDGATLTISGTLSSSIGNIGGWTIESSSFSSGTAISLNPKTPKIVLNNKHSNTNNTQGIFIGKAGNDHFLSMGDTQGNNGGVQFGTGPDNGEIFIIGDYGNAAASTLAGSWLSFSGGDLNIHTDRFSVIDGQMSASGGDIGGFGIGPSEISSSTSGFNQLSLKSSGQITASAISMSGTIVTDDITATAGTIGAFTISGSALSSSNENDTSTLIIDNSEVPSINFFQTPVNETLQKTMFIKADADSQNEQASIISSSNGILKFERQFAYGEGADRAGLTPEGGETSPAYLVGINTITGISDYSGSTNGVIRTAGVAGLTTGTSSGSQNIERITHIGLYGSSSNAYNHYAGYFVGGPIYSENHISASGLHVQESVDGGTAFISVGNSNTDSGTDKFAGIKFTHGGTTALGTSLTSKPAGKILAGKDNGYQIGTMGDDSNLQFYTARNGTDTERLRIDSDGNVGIGTDSPNSELEVAGDIGLTGDIYVQQEKKIYFDSTDTYIGSDDAGSENLFINSDDDVIFSGDSNVGIKYGPYPFINPPFPLSVNGSIFISGSNQSIYFTNHSTTADTYLRIHHNMSSGESGGTYFDVKHHSGADGSIYFRGGGDAKDFIFDTDNQVGTTVTWTSTSDKRLKDNIIKLDNGIDVINKLEPVSFEWNEKSGLDGKEDIGLIAQDVLKVVPEVVEQNITDDTDYYSVTYGKLVPHLIKAVQEQQEQINELKEKIKKLEE